MVNQHFLRGNELAREGNWDVAIVEYRGVLRLSPRYAEAHYNLANALRAKGDLGGAMAEYRLTLLLKPDDATAQSNLGLAFDALGDFSRAIFEHRWAIRLQPLNARARHSLAARSRNVATSTRRAEYVAACRIDASNPDYQADCSRLVEAAKP